MLRLTDRQLHILLGGLCGATLLLLCFFAVFQKPDITKKGEIAGVNDFSEGWIAVYEPSDHAVVEAFMQTADAESVPEGYVRKVTNFPDSFALKKGATVTLTHKVPDMQSDTRYLIFSTKGEKVTVTIDGEVIYETGDREGHLPQRHMIPIASGYQNKTMTIQLTSVERNSVSVESICEGNYAQVLGTAWKENGSYLIMGSILLLCGLSLFLVGCMVKNKIRYRRPLRYSSAEMVVCGMLFLMRCSLVRIWIPWTFGIYFLEVCMILLLLFLHLMIIRSFTNRKRMMSLTDMGSMLVGVWFISVMVLQGLALAAFDMVEIATVIFAALLIVAFTVVLAISVGVYKYREERAVLWANMILLVSVCLQIVHSVLNGTNRTNIVYIPVGVLLYYCVIVGVSLLIALTPREEAHVDEIETDVQREQIVEELNPDLLFASFHTMQNLIKNGSANSAKMLYYISVYFRYNLMAMKHPFELVPFEEELTHILAYLTLQKTRNAGLDFTLECKVKAFEVPRRTLEPMIENAVVHGVAGKDNKGNVVIRTYEREDGYAIQIIDDGCGFDTDHLKKTSATSLKVTLEQLKKNTHARTEVVSRPGKGTVITMILPIPDQDIEEE